MDFSVWEERRLVNQIRPGDVRSDWDRDFARLVHSSAFRRLQSKTQVLGLGESDFYRTRLTHSMEVAQIGRGILKVLQSKYDKESEQYKALPDRDLLSAICLAHDIGHPPFGHGGEIALNTCMRDYGGFEGNGQTLRIISKLDKYSENKGLNPTRRLMLGVLKYPVLYSDVVNKDIYGKFDTTTPNWLYKADQQKPPKCIMDSESDVLDFILEPLNEPEKDEFRSIDTSDNRKHGKSLYHALDTSIMELADDISYGLHDLEDSISLGMISLEHWKEHNKGHEDIFIACHKSSSDIGDKLFNSASHVRKECLGELINFMITAVELTTAHCINTNNPFFKYNAVIPDNIKKLREHIFNLVVKKVIKNENVQLLEFKGQKIISELFEVLNTDPERFLSAPTLARYKLASNPCEQARVVCDYVSGMTDDYATKLYEKLFSPKKGSIFDRL